VSFNVCKRVAAGAKNIGSHNFHFGKNTQETLIDVFFMYFSQIEEQDGDVERRRKEGGIYIPTGGSKLSDMARRVPTLNVSCSPKRALPLGKPSYALGPQSITPRKLDITPRSEQGTTCVGRSCFYGSELGQHSICTIITGFWKLRWICGEKKRGPERVCFYMFGISNGETQDIWWCQWGYLSKDTT
jgi:hypothetical protein